MREIHSGVVSTRAPGTWSHSYSGGWLRFQTWCAQRTPPRVACPAEPLTVALYLQSVAREANTYSVVKSASGMIHSVHELSLVPLESIPTKDPLCKLVRGAAKRHLGLALVNQKEPLTLEILQSAVSLYAMDLSSTVPIVQLMLAVMALVMFVGFLRYQDMVVVMADAVAFYPDHMEIFIPVRKTDQFRLGDVLYVARGSYRDSCPVHLTQLYMDRAGLGGMHVPLIQGFDGRKVRGSRFQGVQLDGTAIPYHQCRRHFIRMMARAMGVPEAEATSLIGTQSCRSGGATRVATSVDFRLFQQHRPCRTSASAHRYILDSTDTRLSVTRAMGY